MGERVITDSAQLPPAGLGTWFGFAAMCLGMFMGVLDIQIVATSLPNIQAALVIPPDWMSWIQTAYLIAEVIAIPLTGLLTRVFTMRGLFVIAISIFTLASLGCALSGGFAELLVWRVVQGFAGGVLIPTVFAAVFLLFPFKTQGIATTIAGVIAVLAPTVGPIVGGWVTESFSWHWLFLINIAPGIVAGLVAGYCLPSSGTDFAHARRLDWPSLILLAMTLAALEIALKEAPHRGWLSGLVLGLLALSVTSASAFIVRTLRRATPIVQLSLFGDRDFTIGCALSFFTGAGLYGAVYLIPVFLAFVYHLGPIQIGAIMLATGAAQLVAAPIAAALERRTDARLLSAFGFAVFAIGLGMSAWQSGGPYTNDIFWRNFYDMLWPQIVRGGALLFCILPSVRLAVAHLPLAEVPDASGLFNLMRNLGGAIGLALVDSVIYGRTPDYVLDLAIRLQAGDAAAAAEVGLPTALFNGQPMPMPDDATIRVIQPMVEKAALVHAVNDAWMMMAIIVAAGLVLLPFVRHRGVPTALAAAH